MAKICFFFFKMSQYNSNGPCRFLLKEIIFGFSPSSNRFYQKITFFNFSIYFTVSMHHHGIYFESVENSKYIFCFLVWCPVSGRMPFGHIVWIIITK